MAVYTENVLFVATGTFFIGTGSGLRSMEVNLGKPSFSVGRCL